MKCRIDFKQWDLECWDSGEYARLDMRKSCGSAARKLTEGRRFSWHCVHCPEHAYVMFDHHQRIMKHITFYICVFVPWSVFLPSTQLPKTQTGPRAFDQWRFQLWFLKSLKLRSSNKAMSKQLRGIDNMIISGKSFVIFIIKICFIILCTKS